MVDVLRRQRDRRDRIRDDRSMADLDLLEAADPAASVADGVLPPPHAIVG